MALYKARDRFLFRTAQVLISKLERRLLGEPMPQHSSYLSQSECLPCHALEAGHLLGGEELAGNNALRVSPVEQRGKETEVAAHCQTALAQQGTVVLGGKRDPAQRLLPDGEQVPPGIEHVEAPSLKALQDSAHVAVEHLKRRQIVGVVREEG